MRERDHESINAFSHHELAGTVLFRYFEIQQRENNFLGEDSESGGDILGLLLGPRTGQDRTIKIRTYVRDQDPKSKKWLCFDPLL